MDTISGQLLHPYHRPVGISLKNGSFQRSVYYTRIMEFAINFILFYQKKNNGAQKILRISKLLKGI